jgi:thiosulfate dehydrogenase [quinone] large subunit
MAVAGSARDGGSSPRAIARWWASRPSNAASLSGWALLPLRAFIGATFLFAGLQKLANPTFWSSANPTGIKAQLEASARVSPVHAILSHLISLSTPIGITIAIAEIAVAIGLLVGLWTRLAAVGGALLSLTLFLTVSFHSSPYYTGADIVFFFAWLPFIIAGAGGVLSLDALLAARPPAPPSKGAIDRRKALGTTAALGALGAGVVVGLSRLIGGAKLADGTPQASSGGDPSTPTTTAPPSSGRTPAGTAIAEARTVPVGGSLGFIDPQSGNPGLIIQRTQGEFVAFDAVCPHAGCTVGFAPHAKLIVCPCHGSEFNPETGGLVRGPAPHGLSMIPIAKSSSGELYVDG